MVGPLRSIHAPHPREECEHGRIGTKRQCVRAPTTSFQKLARRVAVAVPGSTSLWCPRADSTPPREIGDAGAGGPNWPSATWPAGDRPSAWRAPAYASRLPAGSRRSDTCATTPTEWANLSGGSGGMASSSRGRRAEPPVSLLPKAGKMIPCNGIILLAWGEPVGQAMRAQADVRRLSRRREDAIDGERRTTALGGPAREAPPGDYGGAMATTGSHRAKPFGERGRCERRRTKRDPGERCQGTVARAAPCVAGPRP